MNDGSGLEHFTKRYIHGSLTILSHGRDGISLLSNFECAHVSAAFQPYIAQKNYPVGPGWFSWELPEATSMIRHMHSQPGGESLLPWALRLSLCIRSHAAPSQS